MTSGYSLPTFDVSLSRNFLLVFGNIFRVSKTIVV